MYTYEIDIIFFEKSRMIMGIVPDFVHFLTDTKLQISGKNQQINDSVDLYCTILNLHNENLQKTEFPTTIF
jgi:hypothetical protein